MCMLTADCSVEGICKPRGCRRDEFVLTSLLKSNQSVPPLCPSDAFCPDDASACLPLVEAGGRCQLNRDGKWRLDDLRAILIGR